MPHRKQQALVPIKPAVTVTRAAAYVRMSRESQEYSPVNQMTLISKYASDHDMQVVKTYSDEGISGLRIENRPGLRALLTEVVGGSADFSKLLVYDVSRWGRFQDIDESGHYEFICRRAGVEVIYCAELFGADNSLISMFGKMLKRGPRQNLAESYRLEFFERSATLQAAAFRWVEPLPLG